jgi:mRNA deadenylase 3'-5' endonuclease subunit Ccr4
MIIEEKKFNPKPRINHNNKFPFNYRSWVPEIDESKISGETVRIVSYNILCDSLLSISTEIAEEEFERLPYLYWENRRGTIISEITELNPDILCIQEFERDNEMIEAFAVMGYDCSFKPRPGEHSEGCAIFWKNERFSALNMYAIEFSLNYTNDKKNLSNIYDKDNICLFAALELKNTNTAFIVANSHLLFNNNRGDIKLAQAYQILNGIKQLKEFYKQSHNRVCVFLCGDLNSIPNSGVYKYITEGSLDCTEIDRRRVSQFFNFRFLV